VFFSTSTLGGGQETTALSCVPFFAHLGMLFVPLGYRNKSLMNLDQIHGGSPYGSFSFFLKSVFVEYKILI
jgi:NAD(P)H dehydrogenase (quinone)